MAFGIRLNEIIISIGLAVGIIIGFPLVEREWNKDVPIEDWFNVRQLEVAPITPLGQYPLVVFDREVNKQFKATWILEIQNVNGDNFTLYCKGIGSRDFTVEGKLPNQGETSEWFSKTFPDCFDIKNNPGKYRAIVTWTIDRGKGYYPFKLEKISNVFEIVDPETFIPTKQQEAINNELKEATITEQVEEIK